MAGEVRRIPAPPHSLEAEQSVLGGMMLDPTAWARAVPHVSRGDFFRADHRLVFAAIERLVANGEPADAVQVIALLERGGRLEAVGGREYVAQLVEDTPSAANVENYAKIVRDRATMRRLREAAHTIMVSVDQAGDRPAAELVAGAAETLLRLQEGARSGRGLVASAQLARELTDDLARRHEGVRGLAVGLPDFDALSFGLEPGDLIVLAGRPGMGKSALMVSIAAHVSRNVGVAIFSAEMSSGQLMRRCVALLGGISQGELRHPERLQDSDWSTIADATGKLAERRLWIDDTPAPAFAHVRAETLALRTRAPGLGLVIVDYVQLLQGSGNSRYEQLRDVVYGLKALAKQASLPVIVLAQLNRGVESRSDNRRPRLSDLRDSGAIEEAADIVGMLYSEAYYNAKFPMPYVLECAIEKNRNGPRGECLWHFTAESSRIGTLDEGARIQYRRERTAAKGNYEF
ncbi:MAG TPA: replicative DNA helicase [Gammaproteobacteria bacterium]|nr:replicative DNA helicase [Gammaproteobacteria bacterium]